MNSRVQVPRTFSAGNVPAIGSREEGELWLNFPDLQLGFIDTTQTPQRLMGVRLFIPTASYAARDFVIYGGELYYAKANVPPGMWDPLLWTRMASMEDISGVNISGTPPANPDVGNLWFDSIGLSLYIWYDDGTTQQWVDVGGGAPFITLNDTPPINPSAGELWFDNVSLALFIWYNDGASSQWIAVGGSSSGSSVTINPTPPTNPNAGDLWWNSTDLKLYIFYDDGIAKQWVVANPSGGGSSGGLADAPVDGELYARKDANWEIVPTASGGTSGLGDNRVINGDMRIDQRNNGAAGTANGYTIDRWNYLSLPASMGTWQRKTSSCPGFPYMLSFTSSSAYTPAAGNIFYFNQPIEPDLVSDFAFGTAQAQPVTLSFWVQSSLTGMFSGALNNANSPQRSYPFTYEIPIANVWTKISITIPGDTTGAWIMGGSSGIGVNIYFSLGSGATYLGPANTWATAQLVGAIGSTNVVSTNGATFDLTGVKLEIGSVATPFNRLPLSQAMVDCQRYFQRGNLMILAYSSIINGQFGNNIPHATLMRTTPTITPGAYTPNINATAINLAAIGAWGFQFYCQSVAVGSINVQGTYTANAEL